MKIIIIIAPESSRISHQRVIWIRVVNSELWRIRRPQSTQLSTRSPQMRTTYDHHHHQHQHQHHQHRLDILCVAERFRDCKCRPDMLDIWHFYRQSSNSRLVSHRIRHSMNGHHNILHINLCSTISSRICSRWCVFVSCVIQCNVIDIVMHDSSVQVERTLHVPHGWHELAFCGSV